jgi:RNA polymerase sigma factor (sigma-70 family)
VTRALNSGFGDTALLQAAASGHDEAFGRLFDRHATAVCNFLFRHTADWSAAEDLTAAVFLQAWRRRGDVVFDCDSALPWLLGVARMLLRHPSRSRSRYQAVLRRAGAAAAAGRAPGPAEVVAGRPDRTQQADRVRTAIGRLPRQQREVIEMCVYAGLDQEAASISLGISVAAVKSRLHRARQRLVAELTGPPASVTTTGREIAAAASAQAQAEQ